MAIHDETWWLKRLYPVVCINKANNTRKKESSKEKLTQQKNTSPFSPKNQTIKEEKEKIFLQTGLYSLFGINTSPLLLLQCWRLDWKRKLSSPFRISSLTSLMPGSFSIAFRILS